MICPKCGRAHGVARKRGQITPEADGTINHIIAFMIGQTAKTGRDYVTTGEIWSRFSFLTPLQINSRMQSAKRNGRIVSGPKRGTYKIGEGFAHE